MHFSHNERIAAQAAAWFVSKMPGNRMNLIQLSKLLYMADREALSRWGRPIIGGEYSSMAYGPVISPIVDAMKPEGERPKACPIWNEYFKRIGHDIAMVSNPGRGRLHNAAVELLDELFEKFGHMEPFELSKYTHTFKEYTDPGSSSTTIELDKLLQAVGKTQQEINTLINDCTYLVKVDKLVGC